MERTLRVAFKRDWPDKLELAIGRKFHWVKQAEEQGDDPSDKLDVVEFAEIIERFPHLFPESLRPKGEHDGESWPQGQYAGRLREVPPTRHEGAHANNIYVSQAAEFLDTCRIILRECDLHNASEDIAGIRNRLLSEQQPPPIPRSAENLVGQDEEPRDAQSEDATSLAEQDGGPPARRTGGGVDLTRLGLYVTALGVLIAVVLLVAFTTRSGNGPLVCGDIGDVELTGPGDPNGTVALDGYCTGADDDELTFSAASSDNDIVSAAVEGDLLTLTAGDGSDGTATITVTATDPDGRSARASLTVTVNPPVVTPPPNRPPDCDDVGDVTVVEGEEQEVFVSCSDDDGDTITLRVSAGRQTDHHSVSPGTASIDGSGTQSFTITGLRSSADAGHVEIEADDGKGGTDMVRFSVVVDVHEDEPTGTEPPPVVPPEIEGGIRCAPSLVAVNVSVTCEVSLSEGGTPPFTYEWSDSDGGSGGNEDYSTSFRSPGEKTVQLTVRNSANSGNSANSDSDLTKVTVFNRSPEQVDSIPPLTVGEGWGSDEVELGSYFSDPDGDNLTYTATSSNEDCVRPRVVGHNDDELTITGHCEGSATITVIASDGNGGETEQIFTARVVPRPSWFVYCLPNTTSIYYLRGAHGTKHQIDITRSQAEGLWGSSFWDEIAIMSSSDCARWPTGSPYDYDDARREVERA